MSEIAIPKGTENWIHQTVSRDGQVILHIAEHHRSDMQVQSYVKRMREQQTVVVDFLPLDQIKELKETLPRDANGQDLSQNQARVIAFFRKAAELNASDIHLEIGKGGTTHVIMRVHGDLIKVDSISKEDGLSLASTIIYSMCDVAETQFNANRQQDGRLRKEFLQGLGLFGARYAHTPAVYGLYVVMRVLPDESADPPTPEALGFLPEQIAQFRRILQRPEGIIILSGPTGSGKSTTLRSFAKLYLEFTNYMRRLLMIEDPPEGEVEGAVQTAIIADKNNPAAVSAAWVRMMSAGLRLDPDAIIIGEMRDANSAQISVTAALTGHLVLGTVHSNDPINILERLLTMGINPALLTDPQLFAGLISQRLVQLLCENCKKPWSAVEAALTPEQRRLLTENCDTAKLFFRHTQGCDCCHAGITGRAVIAEVIVPDATFMQIYSKRGKLAARAYWHNTLGGITRNAHMMQYVNAGRVDPLAADRVSPLDEDRWLSSECYTTEAMPNETTERVY